VKYTTKTSSLADSLIHLCNNAISSLSTSDRPEAEDIVDNMWRWQQLEAHLEQIGTSWKQELWPALKDIIVQVMRSTKNGITSRENSFALYGYDFMLDSTCKPWLLEVNSSPCLDHSTAITAELCPQMLESLVELVTAEGKETPQANGNFVGRWECCCADTASGQTSRLTDTSLKIVGHAMRTNEFVKDDPVTIVVPPTNQRSASLQNIFLESAPSAASRKYGGWKETRQSRVASESKHIWQRMTTTIGGRPSSIQRAGTLGGATQHFSGFQSSQDYTGSLNLDMHFGTISHEQTSPRALRERPRKQVKTTVDYYSAPE